MDFNPAIPLKNKEIVEQYAKIYLIEKSLLHAMIHKESGGVSGRYRFERNFAWTYRVEEFAKRLGITVESERLLQMTSWGFVQTMGAVARELGFLGFLQELSHPDLGLEFGCKKLRQCLNRHPFVPDAISSYNGGAPYKKGGIYLNQQYVDDVMNLKSQIEQMINKGEL